MRLKRAMTLAFAMLCCSHEIWAQAAFEAAKGTTPLLSTTPFALTADFSQSGIALDAVREFDVSEEDLANHVFSNQLVFNVHFGVAADKGKRTLFSKDRATPGYDANLGIAYVKELQSECFQRFSDGSCQKSRRGGYFGPVATISYSNVKRNTAVLDPSGQILLSDNAENRLDVMGGLRWAPSERHVISLTAGRNWARSSTELLSERQVCTEEQKSSAGPSVTVSDCSTRFIGEPSDINTWRVRADYLSVWKVSADRPGLGFLASGVWNRREGADGTVSLAAGPTVLAKNSARQSHGGLFFVLEDLKSFGDITDTKGHFSLRLYVSIELPQL